MRVWLRLVLVVLIVVLGIRAWVSRPVAPREAPVTAADAGAAASEATAAAVTESLRNAEQRSAGPAWTITRLNWADEVLVVEVETARPAEDARSIAEEIVEPLDDGYEEVLVYVRTPASADDPILHRIQWTPASGYVETSFAER